MVQSLHRSSAAEVFLATYPEGRGVALAAIKKLLSFAESNVSWRMRFVQGAQEATAVNLPGFARVLEVGDDEEGHAYVASEYVSGQSLLRLREYASRQAQPLPVPVATYIGAQIAGALASLAAVDPEESPEPLCHGALSPSNVLLGYSGVVKLTDYHAPSPSNVDAELARSRLGYVSPEQILGALPDTRSDVFSLGVMLHEILTGLRLFSGASDAATFKRVLAGEPPAPRSFNPFIPDDLDDLVMKMLAPNPGDRPQQAAAIRDELLSYCHVDRVSFGSTELAGFLRDRFEREANQEHQRLKPLLGTGASLGQLGQGKMNDVDVTRSDLPVNPLGMANDDDILSAVTLLPSSDPVDDESTNPGIAMPGKAGASVLDDAPRTVMGTGAPVQSSSSPSLPPPVENSGPKRPPSGGWAGGSVLDDAPRTTLGASSQSVLDDAPKTALGSSSQASPMATQGGRPSSVGARSPAPVRSTPSSGAGFAPAASRTGLPPVRESSVSSPPVKTPAKPATTPFEPISQPTLAAIPPPDEDTIPPPIGEPATRIADFTGTGPLDPPFPSRDLDPRDLEARDPPTQIRSPSMAALAPVRNSASRNAPARSSGSRNAPVRGGANENTDPRVLLGRTEDVEEEDNLAVDDDGPALGDEEMGDTGAIPLVALWHRYQKWILLAVGLVVLFSVSLGVSLWASGGGPGVVVKLRPEVEATVTIGGRLVQVGAPLRFPPGEYDLVVVASGYRRYHQRIHIFEKDQSAVFTALLEPEGSQVTDDSAPPSGNPTPPPSAATKPTGTSPAPTAAAKPTPGAAPTGATAVAKPKPKPKVEPPPPTPKSKNGKLLASSQPDGADVWVDGKFTGRQTPLRANKPLELTPGKHTIVFRLAGFESRPRTINVKDGETAKLDNVPLDEESPF